MAISLQSTAPSTGQQLSQAAGAYPTMVQQYQTGQAQLQQAQNTAAMQKLATIQQLLSTNEQFKSSPAAISTVQALYKQFGLTAPMKNGELDLVALGVHAPWQQLLSDSAINLQFNALSPDQRSNFLQQHGVDPSTVPPEVMNAPPYQVTSPAEAQKMSDQMLTEISNLGKGVGNIENIQSSITNFGPIIDRIAGPGASANLASQLNANIGPYVQAKIMQSGVIARMDVKRISQMNADINKMNAETNLDNKKADAEKIITQYLGQMDTAQIGKLNADTAELYASANHLNALASQTDQSITLTKKYGIGSKEWVSALGAVKDNIATYQKAVTDAQGKVDAYTANTVYQSDPNYATNLTAFKQALANAQTSLSTAKSQEAQLLSQQGVGGTATVGAPPAGSPHATGQNGETIYYYSGQWRDDSGDPVQ